MSIKVHYLFSHLDCFPANLGDLSEENGEIYQDIKVMEERYQGRWNVYKMADYRVSKVTAWRHHILGSLTNESL